MGMVVVIVDTNIISKPLLEYSVLTYDVICVGKNSSAIHRDIVCDAC